MHMLAALFRSSREVSNDDATSNWCGGGREFEYIPEPGHWDSETQPSDVSVELNGLASGEIAVVADDSLDVARTSVVFHLSDMSLADKITVTQSPKSKDGQYKLVIDTPKQLHGRFCIRADVHVTLPAQKEPKITLAVAADNARISLADMRGAVRFNTFHAFSKNGRVASRGLNADGAVSISSHNGAVEIEGITAPAIKVESKNGRVVAYASKASGPAGFAADSGNGAVELSNLDVTTLNTNTANGRTTLADVHVSSAEATIRGRNGAITGDITIVTPAALSARTVTGRIELTVGGKPKTIEAATSTGAVALRVTDKDFSGAFDARSTVGRVEVVGGDVHFTGDARSRNVKTGWKGAENGSQSVSAETITGAISLSFA
ncbi:hypothetical protein HDU86_000194 [Geranomyces michiganensis]|nr:hypothetical protein HDU86_000194 [Geranomyces michiganensis]